MAPQSMFENIDLDGPSGASVTEMLGFCGLYIKLVMREGGSERSKMRRERFGTQSVFLGGCCHSVPRKPRVRFRHETVMDISHLHWLLSMDLIGG